MTRLVLSDTLLRSALAPSPTRVDTVELAAVVSTRIRGASQRRRWTLRPWLPSPAATVADARRAQLLRLVLAVALMAAAAGAIAAGACLLPPPAAPPQWILLQNGQGFTMPISGGSRQLLAPFAGLQIADISPSWDGRRLSTVRGKRNEIFEVWQADWVFAGRETQPVTYALPADLRLYDAGVWRRDGTGIIVSGTDHGVSRIYLLDLVTGSLSQLTPDGMSVDDWQPAPNDEWLEVLGQRDNVYGLFVLDIDTRDIRTAIESDGKTIPTPGALGWSPDSTHMTVLLEKDVIDKGIWAVATDGSDPVRLTPEGRQAYWMNWSPDGAWIMFLSPNAVQTCGNRSISNSTFQDTWIVRPDGTDAHVVAPGALPLQWSDDGRSVLVESQVPRPDAPLGGVIRAPLDGGSAELVYAYTERDLSGDICHRYGVWTRLYRGASRGTH